MHIARARLAKSAEIERRLRLCLCLFIRILVIKVRLCWAFCITFSRLHICFRFVSSCAFSLCRIGTLSLRRISAKVKLLILSRLHVYIDGILFTRLLSLLSCFSLLAHFLLPLYLTEIHLMNTRDVLRIRHIPDLQHITDRRDKERERIHILYAGRKSPYQLAIYIYGTSAHTLQRTARLLYDGAGCLSEYAPVGALAIIEYTSHRHVE